jgi:hypothetical protein
MGEHLPSLLTLAPFYTELQINVWVMAYSIITQLIYFRLPGRNTLYFYICSGKDPTADEDTPTKSGAHHQVPIQNLDLTASGKSAHFSLKLTNMSLLMTKSVSFIFQNIVFFRFSILHFYQNYFVVIMQNT